MKEWLAKSYDRCAHEYDRDFSVIQIQKYITLVGVNAEEVQDGLSVIDLGGGTGLLSDFLKRAGKSNAVITLDLSEKMIRESKYKGHSSILGDIEDLPLKSDSFDIATIFTVLLNIPLQEERIISEVNRILKPHGVLYLSVLKKHCNVTLVEMLQNTGFHVLEISDCGQDRGYICRKNSLK